MASTQTGPSTPAIPPDRLSIPQPGDSVAVMQQKLAELADAVRRGQSIATVTEYAASTVQERDPVRLAVSEMPPLELDSWAAYAEGKYRLPKLDWDESRLPAPTSRRPLRTARRRAEALNRLYETDKADSRHAVWFTKNEDCHLHLVKAMARVIGAERNLLGGQGTLNVTQMAELQSINEILSVSAPVLAGRSGAMSQTIASTQRILGSRRDMLRGYLEENGRKRKRESEWL